jgi:hypothetical protein
MDAVVLGRSLGVSSEEAVAIKERTLSAIAKKPIDTKPYPDEPSTPNTPPDTDISEAERQAVEKQLRLLKDLYQKELLSEEQYEACVKEVLKDILD